MAWSTFENGCGWWAYFTGFRIFVVVQSLVATHTLQSRLIPKLLLSTWKAELSVEVRAIGTSIASSISEQRSAWWADFTLRCFLIVVKSFWAFSALQCLFVPELLRSAWDADSSIIMSACRTSNALPISEDRLTFWAIWTCQSFWIIKISFFTIFTF